MNVNAAAHGRLERLAAHLAPEPTVSVNPTSAALPRSSLSHPACVLPPPRVQHDLELKQVQRQLDECLAELEKSVLRGEVEEEKAALAAASAKMEQEFFKLVEQLESKQVAISAAAAAKEEMVAASTKTLTEQYESELSTLAELLELAKQSSISAAALAKVEATKAKEEALAARTTKLTDQYESELSSLTELLELERAKHHSEGHATEAAVRSLPTRVGPPVSAPSGN